MAAPNAKLPQSLDRNENDDKEQTENITNNLDASRYVEANTDQCRKMKTHTHELSRSGDALLTDAEIDDHLEQNANGYVKPEMNLTKRLMILLPFIYLVISSESNAFSYYVLQEIRTSDWQVRDCREENNYRVLEFQFLLFMRTVHVE